MALLHDLLPYLDENGFWPEAGPVDNTDISLAGEDGKPVVCLSQIPWMDEMAWRLDLCRDGTMSIRARGQEPFNGRALPVYYAEDLETLRGVQRLMCSRAYDRDARLTYEGGDRFMFWWFTLPGTLWQLSAVSRVVDMFVSFDDAGKARAEARRLDEIVRDAAWMLRDSLRPA